MKKVVQTLFFALFLLFAVAACSPKHGIYEAKAYVRESSRGTQMVDDNNQPVGSRRITENLLFVETALDQDTPVITAVWIDKKPYSAQLQKVAAGTNIGKLKDAGEAAVVTTKEGRQLWQVMVTENEAIKLDSSVSSAVRNNPVVITGNRKGKTFVYRVENRIPLESFLYQ